MGSGRLDGFLGSETRDDVLEAVEEGAAVSVDDGGWAPGRGRLRPRKISAVLRMWEKSWQVEVRFSHTIIDVLDETEGSNCWFDAS